jgi:hypothetical protein
MAFLHCLCLVCSLWFVSSLLCLFLFIRCDTFINHDYFSTCSTAAHLLLYSMDIFLMQSEPGYFACLALLDIRSYSICKLTFKSWNSCRYWYNWWFENTSIFLSCTLFPAFSWSGVYCWDLSKFTKSRYYWYFLTLISFLCLIVYDDLLWQEYLIIYLSNRRSYLYVT